MASPWPLRSLFLYFSAGSRRRRGSGQEHGGGRNPRSGEHTGKTKGNGERKAPDRVLGMGSWERAGERAAGSRGGEGALGRGRTGRRYPADRAGRV